MYESTIGGVAVRSNPEVPLLFLGYNRCGHCGEERGISMIREARPACGRGHTFLLLSIASRINLSQCLVNARTLGKLNEMKHLTKKNSGNLHGEKREIEPLE
ncbi:hypothetical protein HZH66_009992 [Vespula vulgaris]|uniref:Uncharacterized protein n=1 Tax=Vespula vulgaris TaxID=7454 RepID=A0A834JIU5_VESVU|nr:hypothetical protein HZH66_009992 [Vespula vulgaris]